MPHCCVWLKSSLGLWVPLNRLDGTFLLLTDDVSLYLTGLVAFLLLTQKPLLLFLDRGVSYQFLPFTVQLAFLDSAPT